MTDEKSNRKLTRRSTTEPVYLSKLYNFFQGDSTKTAYAMGCHPSSVTRGLNSSCSNKIENLAKGAYFQLPQFNKDKQPSTSKGIPEIVDDLTEGSSSEDQLYICLVPPNKLATFQKLMAMLHIEATSV